MSSIDALTIDNVDLMVLRQLEHCPQRMMPRELTMNAIEAASQDYTGNGLVVFGAIKDDVIFGDTRKLFIWNNGPGMNANELVDVTNLSSTRNKSASLHVNFGIGAKVASLLSNKLGFSMISCRSGRVHQVIIVYNAEENKFCRYKFDFGDGIEDSVRDITDEMPKYSKIFSELNDIPKSWNLFDTSRDWTAITLFGNYVSQDTVISPFGDSEKQTGWLPSSLYRRFWSIPENVSIYLSSSVFTRDASRYFAPISQRFNAFTKHEVVILEEGIKIHYLHDAKVIGKKGSGYLQSYNGALCQVSAFGCIVYKGEMYYDYSEERDWVHNAKYFGIPFGYKNLSVAVELPDGYEVSGSKVLPNSYRTAIMYGHNKEDVKARHFSRLVIENRPKWFLDVIEENSPAHVGNSEIRKQLQDLLDELLLKENSLTRNKDGDTPSVPGNRGRGGGGKKLRDIPNPNPQPSNKNGLNFNATGSTRALTMLNKITAPDFRFLTDEEMIEEQGITNKAASFDDTNNLIYINGRYKAFDAICDDLMDRHASHPDQNAVMDIAMSKAKDIMTVLIGRVVVYAKAKINKSQNWSEAEIEKALSPESLTMAADSWATNMMPYHQEMSRAFKLEKAN
jgi:hypothetical protein